MSRSYFANARINPIENNAQVRDDRRYRYPDKPEPTMRHLRPARSLPARLTTPTLQLLEGVQTMEESTTFQTILGEGRAARRSGCSSFKVRFAHLRRHLTVSMGTTKEKPATQP